MRLRHGIRKEEICAELGMPFDPDLLFPPGRCRRAVRLVRTDTGDGVTFKSIYNLSRTLGLNTGMVYNKLRGGGRTVTVSIPTPVWRSEGVVGVGEYTVEAIRPGSRGRDQQRP